MKKTKNMYPAEHINAIRKSKTNFIRLSGGDAQDSFDIPRFMQEADENSIGEPCTVFRVEDFVYNSSTGMIWLRAAISFPCICDSITLCASLIDPDSETVIEDLDKKSIRDEYSMIYEYSGIISAQNTVSKAAVIVYAGWSNAGEKDGKAALYEENGVIEIDYLHKYPKKEKECVVFGTNYTIPCTKEEYERQKELEGREESGNIVISLFRMPEDKSDVDYLCQFGRKNGSIIVGAPGMGTLILKTAKARFVNDSSHITSAVCLLKEKGTGRGQIIAFGDSNDVQYRNNRIKFDISDTQITYSMIDPWDESARGEGNFAPHYCDYEFCITCYIQLDDTINKHIYYISSSMDKSSFCLERIQQITLKWGCLAENTMILMADGSRKPVQDIRISDCVLSEDSQSVQVTNTWRGTEEECVSITAENGAQICVTRTHPLKTDTGWKRASELAAGDILCTENGGARIEKTETVTKTINVYNPETNGKAFYANGFISGDYMMQNED